MYSSFPCCRWPTRNRTACKHPEYSNNYIRKHNIFGFDIPVKDVLLVEIVDSIADFV